MKRVQGPHPSCLNVGSGAIDSEHMRKGACKLKGSTPGAASKQQGHGWGALPCNSGVIQIHAILEIDPGQLAFVIV